MEKFLWLLSDGGPKKEPDLRVRVAKAVTRYVGKFEQMPARVVMNLVELPAGAQSVELELNGKKTTVRLEGVKWMPKLCVAVGGVANEPTI